MSSIFSLTSELEAADIAVINGNSDPDHPPTDAIPQTFDTYWLALLGNHTLQISLSQTQAVRCLGLVVGLTPTGAANVTLSHSDTLGGDYTEVVSAEPLARVSAFIFPETTARFWRLSIEGLTASTPFFHIGLCPVVEFDRDPAPPFAQLGTGLATVSEATTRISTSGRYLGRQLRARGQRTEVYIPALFGVSHLLASLKQHLGGGASFFVAIGSVGFVWLEGDFGVVPTIRPNTHDLRLALNAY